MLNNQHELFLSEYFFCRSVLGKLVKDAKRLYDTLGHIFMIDGARLDALYALTENETVVDVKTYADYLQFCRIKKYVALMGGESDIPSDIEDIVVVKGEALGRATTLRLDGSASTESAVLRTVTESAALGVVSAMRILGFIQCEGIGTDRDTTNGIKNLERAAQWNNVEGILAALYYNADSRFADINRLRTVADGTVYRMFTAKAEHKYGCIADTPVFESTLLQKAFALGKLKPEQYSAQYARIIFSAVIGPRDKERTLFSSNEQAISDVAELPLKLQRLSRVPDGNALGGMPIVRQKEQERIRQCLFNSDLMYRSAFRPLCVCADSEYMRRLYARYISAAFNKAHIEYIDIAGLDEYDLQPSSKNIFVRSCDEDAFNIYFMSFDGNIADGVMQEAIGFLQSRRRKKFCLQSPGVVIDLAAVLPVCFCDKANAKELKKYCDVITVGAITATEKPSLFEDIIAYKQRLYGTHVTIDDGAKLKLAELSIDGAESVIDAVVRFNRNKAETVITPALIDECATVRTEKNRYGFGGDGDEI